MKKKTYSFVASFLLMLVATLTSCEKFALDDTSTISHDANANVTIHVSMRTNQPQEMATKATSGEANNGEATSGEAIPLEKVCSRLSLAIFDGGEKVKVINMATCHSPSTKANTVWLSSGTTEPATAPSVLQKR